jgi:hypothetical protein
MKSGMRPYLNNIRSRKDTGEILAHFIFSLPHCYPPARVDVPIRGLVEET